jgi:diaminopimelate decarboxylase
MSMAFIWQSVEELQERGGSLFFDGCSVADLASQFGTPLYAYSETRLRKNYRRLHDAVRRHCDAYEIYYALKVNGNPSIVEVLSSEGAGADCASLQEVAIAQEAGIPPHRILFSGAYISRDELARAVELGIQINLAETCHLEELARTGPPALLSFRINPGDSLAQPDTEFVLAGCDSKFGITPEEAVVAYARAAQLGVKQFGIHAMASSNVLDVEYFDRLLAFVCRVASMVSARTGIDFQFVNIGGALGVPYRMEQQALDVTALGRRLAATLRQSLPGVRLRLIQEPGRYLAADAGILLTRVTSIKRAAETFVGVDAGMNTLVRPAMYGAYHHIVYPADLRLPHDMPVNVVGQICEARDVIARQRPLPRSIAVGDVLALLDAGAYGFAMSSRFHAKPAAAEVLVCEGAAELIRVRPGIPELFGNTRRASWLRPEPEMQVG